MSIRFDTDKCWIRDPDSLRIKRYLSETRSYFREGRWIRSCFQSFFPGIRTDDEGFLFYDLTTMDPPITAVRAACLEETLIPTVLLESLQQAIDAYVLRVQEGGLHFNEEMACREFTLPDPESHPELYWVVETEFDLRLIILWGLHSDFAGANLRVESLIEKLIFQFEGKAVLRRVDAEPDPRELEPPISAAPNAKAPAQSPESVAGNSNPPVARKRNRLGRCLLTAALGVLGIAGFSELCHHFMGRSLTITESEALPHGPSGFSFVLDSGENIVIPGIPPLRADPEPLHVTIPRLPQPGRYALDILQSDSSQPARRLSTTFNPRQDDMHHGPVAALTLERKHARTGESISAFAGHSFHEMETEQLDYFISWGEEASAFLPVDPESLTSTYTYSNPGTYTVQLLVVDAAGQWDYDRTVVRVAEVDSTAPVTNFRPVLHASMIALFPHEGGARAILDTSNSWDPDGHIDTIEIDWGDGSMIEQFPSPGGWHIHDYRGRNNRITLRIDALDDVGERANEPIHLFLDFQSAEMNTAQPLNEESAQAPFKIRWLDSTPNNLRLVQHSATFLQRNLQPLRFELLPPPDQPFVPLLDVQWELTDASGDRSTHRGGFAIDILAPQGPYQLQVRAHTPEGTVCTASHRFTVSTDDRMHPLYRVMQWWYARLPFLSPSYHLGADKANKGMI
ncbi:MAG: hypothetical protein ABQ298_10625 [Puniceicoccaceae bacterium]